MGSPAPWNRHAFGRHPHIASAVVLRNVTKHVAALLIAVKATEEPVEQGVVS